MIDERLAVFTRRAFAFSAHASPPSASWRAATTRGLCVVLTREPGFDCFAREQQPAADAHRLRWQLQVDAIANALRRASAEARHFVDGESVG